MANRFERLFQLPERQYIEGSPVILAAGVLSKDTETGSIIAQLKFQSVSENRIKAIKVSLAAYDVSKSEVQGVTDYQYLELNVGNGQEFGSNKAIVMPSSVTRSFAVSSILVVFNDGSMWESSGSLSVLPAAKNLSLGSSELNKQYRIATNDSAAYTPVETQGLWQCSCGTWNKGTTCTHCRILKSKVFSALNLDALAEQMNARHAKEQAQREAEAARQAELRAEAEVRRQKNKKLLIRLGVIALAVAILVTIGIVVYNKLTELTMDKILPLYTKEDVVALLGESNGGTSVAQQYDVTFMGEKYSLIVSYDNNKIKEWSLTYMYPGAAKLESAKDIANYTANSKEERAANAVLSKLLESFKEKYGEPKVSESETIFNTYTWIVNDRMIVVYDDTGKHSLSSISPIRISVNCDHQSFCEHTDTNAEHKDATCTENGYDRTTCTICGYVDETVLKAFGHSESSEIIKVATCSEMGEKKFLCSTCGKERTETIDTLPHTYKETILKAATCTEKGSKNQTCSDCGYCTSEEPIAELGHEYSRVTTKAAGCESEGTYTFTCGRCKDSYKESIPAKGHTMTPASCTEPERCSGCGKTGANAHGHSWGKGTANRLVCLHCNIDYPPNITILASLPYTSYFDVTIESVTIIEKHAIAGYETPKICVTLQFKGVTKGDLGLINVRAYDSSGQRAYDSSIYASGQGVFVDDCTLFLDDGGTYTLKFS